MTADQMRLWFTNHIDHALNDLKIIMALVSICFMLIFLYGLIARAWDWWKNR